MKTKYFMQAVVIIMAAMVCCAFYACTKDDSNPTPAVEQEPKGEVVFTISSDGSTGTGTGSSPAVVQTGDTLNMAISQKSSYTDPNGSVFVCEPKADIKVSAAGDTLYVKDFQTLTTVKENPQATSEASFGEKQTKKMLQTFNVGGKEVYFDLAYDVFKHINSQQQSIEMPYVKLNAASYGAAKAAETRSAAVAVTGMRIKPHNASQTRGVIVDSVAYDVTVEFNLEIESVHTNGNPKQILSFEVEFPAVVESTTDYPDPNMQFSYQLQVLGGTNSTASPFMLNLGETMHLQWEGNCQYSYFRQEDRTSQTISNKPKANVKLFTSKDTLWATTKDELEKFVATDAVITQEGTSPLVTKGQKTFSIKGNDILFDWSYESYDNVNAEGTEVAMPHLELSEPQIVSVQATELPNVTIPGKAAKVYEVEIRLSQELKSVDAPESKSETIEYVVKCIGAIEVKLVKVVYRKDWEWRDSHDNMLLAYYPMVHRDRIYSTGETFTDTFRDYGHLASSYMEFIGTDSVKDVSDGKVRCSMSSEDYRDSIHVICFSAAVPNLSKVIDVFEVSGDMPVDCYITPPPGAWEEYILDKDYEGQDISLEGIAVIGANRASAKPSGWYAYCPDYVYHSFVCVYGDETRFDGAMHIRFYDQFLVIDGQMITFLEYRGPMQFNYHKNYITMPNGAPGFVYTTEFRQRFLEKNFYISRVDSIYQQKP